MWAKEATEMLVDLLSGETFQFTLTNSNSSKETREEYYTLLT